ncbi:TetR/AcrR family transcriptional regulator [Salicibibacter halophilus]|uniref:TetR/AcrR family transcriptional regulator n=1 Tax=Salicibibacter halophilus TaxID=2502791 RepID=A0A514LLF2_9BACI|nr:TetR/AcrR family transcriptional regulator [Salicibibacter halophilus]QDI92694.1 TetR/AcrR family transcriptional regulator [Salicibibacter halophilus]
MKEQIMENALQSFAIDGYYATSMQQIAENCGISKASLYKYFTSKEALLLETLEYNLDEWLKRTTNINLDQSLSPKEELRQKIVIELEAMKNNRSLVHSLMRAVPLTKNAEMMRMLKRTRVALMNWHRDSLLHAYGETLRPFLWDRVALFQGTLREYVVLMGDDHKALPAHDVADLIISHLDTLMTSSPGISPVLTSDVMHDYEMYQQDMKPAGVQEEIDEVCYLLREKVKNHANIEQQPEVDRALETLYRETEADAPRTFLLDALCLYLEQWAPIENERKKLYELLESRDRET